MPARLARGMGCSIRSTPAASSRAMAPAASASFQAWFTSTVTRARSPSACLMRETWATSSDTGRRPTFSLNVLWRRLGSSDSASRCRGRCRRWPGSTAPAGACAPRRPAGSTDGHAQALALGVQQRALQRRLRVAVAAGHGFQPAHGRVQVGRVQAGQGRRQVGIDGQLDAFRAFLAIGQAADGGGLADAFDAVAAAQAHDHQRLALHDRHGASWWARIVGRSDQDGFDRENACLIHTFIARDLGMPAVWLAFSS